MKKLKFFKNILSFQRDPSTLVNNWIIKNRNELTSYQFFTSYSETGDDGESVGNDIDLVYTTKNNKPIPPSKNINKN